jgi:carbazole 1,9a-dioxygenase terminal dioxygenase component
MKSPSTDDVPSAADADSIEVGTATRSSWAPYVQAKLGFRNYWYPALFADELDGGVAKGVRLLGENVLLRRVGDRVAAVQDRCLHRGVRFSRKPECYTPDTITCWYHGFTYNLLDGKLVDILTEPGSKMIGKIGIRTYPVAEKKGIVFVYVGDGEPPPLAADVPPGFLDDELAVNGIRDEVASNWRIGAENGFDTTHIYIHRDSPLIGGNRIMLPIGLVPVSKEGIEVHATTDPKGVFDAMAQNYTPVFEGTIRGEKVVESRGARGEKMVAASVSIWMPGALKVDPFPDPSLVQFEWYVPIDVDTHMYWRVLGKRVANETDAAIFTDEFHSLWKTLALRGFNDLDVWAREGMQEFYKSDEAWGKEHLFKPDACIVEWRKLASKHHRGLQPAAPS